MYCQIQIAHGMCSSYVIGIIFFLRKPGLQAVTFFNFLGWGETDKGMVRSDVSKPALIFFFHCKNTHNKIHYQNSSC
jgi:hypothetical protein